MHGRATGHDVSGNGDGGNGDGDGERGTGRSRRRWALGIGLVIALYAVGLAVVGVRDAIDALLQAHLGLLLLAAGLQVLTVGTLGMVVRASAGAIGLELPYRRAVNISMSWFTLSQTVPGGGAVAGAEAGRRLAVSGASGPAATAAVGLLASLATATITAIAGIGITLAVLDAELPGVFLAITVVVLVLLLLGATTIVRVSRNPSSGDRVLGWLSDRSDKLRERIEEWRDSLGALADDPPELGDVGRIVGWSSINWCADIAALWLVIVALGFDASLAMVLVAFGVSQVGAAIPVTPGGVGFVESGMLGALVTMGMPASEASTVVLLYRVLATWGPALAGTVPLLRPPDGEAVEESDDDTHRGQQDPQPEERE